MAEKKNKGVAKRKRKQETSNHPKADNYLLAIGINAYQHFTPLNNAVKDVQDFASLLTTHFGFNKEEPYTRLLKDKEATRRNIIQALNQLCHTVKPEDRVLIYYSGHGVLEKHTNTDLGYWIPVDADKDYIADYITNSEVRDLIKSMYCKHILLISDSCWSGSLLVRDVTTEVEGAFDQWEASSSRWIFCSGKGVVSDGKKGENSPFAHQLIRYLSEESLDKFNINSLADKVIKTVRFNYEQQAEACPLFGAGHDGGQFIFYRTGGNAPPLPLPDPDNRNEEVLPIPPKDEETTWELDITRQKELIARNDISRVFSNIKAWLQGQNNPGNLENDSTLLTNQYNSLQREIRLGLMSQTEKIQQSAQINWSLLGLIDEIERIQKK